jgi:hypothetical protein
LLQHPGPLGYAARLIFAMHQLARFPAAALPFDRVGPSCGTAKKREYAPAPIREFSIEREQGR